MPNVQVWSTLFRETPASVCVEPVQVTHPEAHRELCFWAHGGNGAKDVGTVITLFIYGCGVAFVQFI